MFRFIGFVTGVVLAVITGSAVGETVQNAIAGWVIGFICWLIVGSILSGIGALIDEAIASARFDRQYGRSNKPLVFAPTMKERIDGWLKRTPKRLTSNDEDFTSFLGGSRTTKREG